MSAVELDVQKLHNAYDRLLKVSEAHKALLSHLDTLRISLPIKIAIKSIVEQGGDALAACRAYLENTANDYVQVEKDIIYALKTGKYVLSQDVPAIIPQSSQNNSGMDQFVQDHQKAFVELYNMVRDGKYSNTAFLEWLYRNFISDPEALRKIFGDDDSQVFKLVEMMSKVIAGLVDFVDDGIGLAESISGSEVKLPKGMKNIGTVFSALDAIGAEYELAVGVAALIVGFAFGDDKLTMAGADYIDDSLSSIADLVLAVTAPGGPYGWAIGIGVDVTINKITNLVDGIVQKDSPGQMMWRMNVAPWLETAMDLTSGNFFCQMYVKGRYQTPLQPVVNAVVDELKDFTGVDLEQIPLVDTLCNNDNWLGAFNDWATKWNEDLSWLK